MLVLFADSDSDITPEAAAEYGYHLISMPYSVDGKTVYPYQDFDVFDADSFYNMLRGGVIPTTSAISEEEYIGYFEPHFAAGNDILYVHFSREMTNSFTFMDKAVSRLLEKYPERRFYPVNTRGISVLTYNMAMEIGDMLKAGASPEEVMAWAENEAEHFATYFFSEDLKFFHRSGRVSGLSATMGTLIGIRPIMRIFSDGKMNACGKEKGRKKAVARLVQTVIELEDHIKEHRIVIGHAGDITLATDIAAGLKAHFGDDLNIIIVNVNPTAGCHCGPDSVGISFHAVHR